MKRIVKLIIGIAIIGLICFGVYKFFFDCEKHIEFFDDNFTLKINDYAHVNNEAIVKLIKIEDDRCLDESCEREGQLKAKLIVLNNKHITYVTLGTLSEKAKDLEKLKYRIELVDATNENATIKLTRLES